MKKHMTNLLPSGAYTIPYSERNLINSLKQRFGICARREQGTVGVTNRKHGIPALVLLPSSNLASDEGKILDQNQSLDFNWLDLS